jgi:flagellin-like hook-associated protein FlgL
VKSYLTEAESAADGLNELLQSAYEEIVSAVSGSKNESDLSIIADEIDNFKKEAVSIGNTSMGTSFIFGGFNFSGTTDGINVTQPFSVNEATGHLTYNGIDLTKVSWAEDFDENMDLMSSYLTVKTDNTAALDSASSDAYARDTICQKALAGLNNLVESGKKALNAAKNYGIDEGSAEYKRLWTLIYGEGKEGESGYIMGLKGYATALNNECSKKLSAEGGAENAFSIASAKSILSGACELIYNTSSTEGLDYSLHDATDSLQAVIDSDMAAEGTLNKLAGESGKRARLQIGYGHSMEYTFTGLDLMARERRIFITYSTSARICSGAGTPRVYRSWFPRCSPLRSVYWHLWRI